VHILSATGGPNDRPLEWASIIESAARGQVAHFEGNPLQLAALRHAGIQQASRIIVLASQRAKVDDIADFVPDTDAMYIFSQVQKFAPRGAFVSMELMDSESVKFIDWDEFEHVSDNNRILHGKRKSKHAEPAEDHSRVVNGAVLKDIRSHFPYATGQIFSSLITNLLMSKVHKTPTIQKVFTLLVHGSTVEANDGSTRMSRSLAQMDVPAKLAGRPYSKLFQHMVRIEGVIPLGLYGKRGNTQAVVITNPKPTLVVNKGDKVYVLAVSRPRSDYSEGLWLRSRWRSSPRSTPPQSPNSLSPTKVVV